METVVWKPVTSVVGAEGIYDVSSSGQIRRSFNAPRCNSTKPGRLLNPDKHNSGYLRVTLRGRDCKLNRVFVHRLVAREFLDGFQPFRQVNHKNGMKHDNRVENLEWVTVRENILHAWRTGLSTPNRGENSGRAKISNRDASVILSLLSSGVQGVHISTAFGITQGAVSAIKCGKSWRHLTPNNNGL